jgi:hypothetical protein
VRLVSCSRSQALADLTTTAAAPFNERLRTLILVPRPMPAVSRRYLAVVPRPLPAAMLVVRRRYLIGAPGRCPRRRSMRVAGNWPWCPGRCSGCRAGT